MSNEEEGLSNSSDENGVYDVETILAERCIEGKPYYLVHWAGYTLERCSWEPVESFDDPEDVLNGWREKQAAIANGREKQVDVADVERRIIAYTRARERKHALRKGRKRPSLRNSQRATSTGRNSRSKSQDSLAHDSLFVEQDDTMGEASPNEAPNDMEHESSSVTARTVSYESKMASKKPPLGNANPKSTPTSRPRRDSEPEFISSTTRTEAQPTADRTKRAGSAATSSRKKSPAASFSQQTTGARAAASNTTATTVPAPSRAASEKTGQKSNLSRSTSLLRPGSATSAGARTEKPPPPGPVQALARGTKRHAPRVRSMDMEDDFPGPKKPRASIDSHGFFTKISTQRRANKPRETMPDISQLDLRRPDEWDPPNAHVPPRRPLITPQKESDANAQTARTQDADSSKPIPKLVRPPPPLASTQLPPSLPPVESPGSPGPTQTLPPVHHAPKYRDFERGREALVSLQHVERSFGIERSIGHVVLGYLLPQSLGKLVALKGKSESIELCIRETCSPDEYRRLCSEAPNQSKLLVSGYVRGFADTQGQVDDFADYLTQNNQIGLWYNPMSRFEVFLFYSRESRAWDFLDDAVAQYTPSRRGDSKLRFALHTYLPSLNVLRPPSSFQSLAGSPLSSVTIESQIPAARSVPHPLARGHDNDNMTSGEAKASPQALPTIAPGLQGADLKKHFQDYYKISFSRLSYLPNTTVKAHVFYLCFPSEASDELDLLKRYLSLHQVGVYSTNSADDWNNFRLATDKMGGVILIHTDFVNFQLLPGLARQLRKPVNVFSISLRAPLDPQSTVPYYHESWFSLGGAILVTDDVILNNIDAALDILEWYPKFMRERNPTTWKLVFRPNIQQWLANLANSWPDDKMRILWMRVDGLIPPMTRFNPNVYRRPSSPLSLDGNLDEEEQVHPIVSPSYIPLYGTLREEDCAPDVPKGITQGMRNTDHLIEYFAGWSMANVTRYRKFLVVTAMAPLKRWSQWTHIDIIKPEEFFRSFIQPLRIHEPALSSGTQESGATIP